MDLIQGEHLSKQYHNHTALDDVSISIPKGSVFGLLGPNGAGKTSLIRMLTRITLPDKGIIRFDGELLDDKHSCRIGYLPEERGLYGKMEVGEQAIYLTRLKGLSKQEAARRLRYWFEKFEMQAWWKKKVSELSKGMQQKLQFIITIVHRPELLILDEPFSGFDPINADMVRNEIHELNKEGTTIVLSTHRMESVEEMCSHIALIHQSRMILEGTIPDIRERNKTHIYEIEYGGSAIAFSNALWSGFELLENMKKGSRQMARIRLLHDNSVNSLLEALLTHVQIFSITETIPSMNEIFITSVKEHSHKQKETAS
jgi:ABC-2 type transport system ATP-binding protein